MLSHTNSYYRMVQLQGNAPFVDYNFSIRLFFFFPTCKPEEGFTESPPWHYNPAITEESDRQLTNQSPALF